MVGASRLLAPETSSRIWISQTVSPSIRSRVHQPLKYSPGWTTLKYWHTRNSGLVSEFPMNLKYECYEWVFLLKNFLKCNLMLFNLRVSRSTSNASFSTSFSLTTLQQRLPYLSLLNPLSSLFPVEPKPLQLCLKPASPPHWRLIDRSGSLGYLSY